MQVSCSEGVTAKNRIPVIIERRPAAHAYTFLNDERLVSGRFPFVLVSTRILRHADLRATILERRWKNDVLCIIITGDARGFRGGGSTTVPRAKA